MLVGITFAPVASYRVNEQISVGGGPNIMVAYMKNTVNTNTLDWGRQVKPMGRCTYRIRRWESAASSASSLNRKKHPCRSHVLFSDQVEFLHHADLLGPGNHRKRSAKPRYPEQTTRFGHHSTAASHAERLHELNDRWAVMGDFGWENWSKFGEVDVSSSVAPRRRSRPPPNTTTPITSGSEPNTG